MFRCVPLLCLFFLAHSSFGQSISLTTDDVPDACSVTTRSQATSFIPPKPYQQAASTGTFWFGTDKLWTFLPIDGTWRGLGHYAPNDPTFRQKVFFWRQGYDWRADPNPKLRITGRRLDGEADPLFADKASNVSTDPAGMVVAINLPAVGCWEITARYGHDALTFVVWVTAEKSSCGPPVSRLPATNPAYGDAMELAEALSAGGIRVDCIAQAKIEQMFDGQTGAAHFQTDAGDFEAFFLQKSQNWDGLEILEQRYGSEYFYQFRGIPKYEGTWEGRRNYFVKHQNRLIQALEPQTAARLREVLQSD